MYNFAADFIHYVHMKPTFYSLLLFLLILPQSLRADWNDAASNVQITPTGIQFLDPEMQCTPDGYTYCYWCMSGSEGTMAYRVQIIDPNGARVCRTAGLTVCNEPGITWTKVNYPTMVDSDGNFIIACTDLRYQDKDAGQYYSYTIYKINRAGEVLWGTTLNDSIGMYEAAHITMAQDAAGNYVFAYATAMGSYADRYVQVERLSADGTPLFDHPVKIEDAVNHQLTYPTIMPMQDGDAMLVMHNYSTGEYILQRLDADCQPRWQEPVTVYAGGYTSQYVWDCVDVRQLADTTFTLAVIDGNKDLLFVNMDCNGNNLIYDADYRRVAKADYATSLGDFYYDATGEVINVAFRQIDADDSYTHGIFVQQMATDGSWLLEDEGNAVIDIQRQDQYGYVACRATDKADEMAVFYIKKEGTGYISAAQCYITRYNYDGECVMQPVAFTASDYSKSSLQVSQLIDNQYYLCSWLEKRGTAEYNSVYLQRVYLDGSVELALEHVRSDEAQQSTVLYDLQGRSYADASARELAHGIYVAHGQKIMK